MFSVVHYETREVRSQVVNSVTAQTLLPAMREQADLARLWLQTDGSRSYDAVARYVADHQYVIYDEGQYVGRGGVSTNLAEGFFSQLKRSLDGTHHHVSPEHLQRYLSHFDFMYSHCRDTDTARMRLLLGRAGGCRLTYKPLTAR